jgi:Rod binding domain-containing protein
VSNVSNVSGAFPFAMTPKPIQIEHGVKQDSKTAAENTKIEKSAKEFESILLGSWLQQAEQSFGSLPGGDDDGDQDVGKEQFQGMAMQSLGTSMAAAGGIGIAKMIAGHLHKAENIQLAASAEPIPAQPRR